MANQGKPEIKYSAPDTGMLLIGVLVVIITLGMCGKEFH